MLVSYKLLKEIVDFPNDVTPFDIADKLTFHGVEVEEVIPLAQATNLTTGKIISCEKHPDSDHLHLLEVDCGEHGNYNIVCGAPNARKDLKVIVALPGADLKAKGLVIKPTKIAGYESNGMCCSLSELGVNEELLSEAQKNGIEELPEDTELGNDDVLGLLGLDDTILNLNILANRPDLSSVLGIARELSAIYSCSYKKIENIQVEKDNKIKVTSLTPKCLSFGLLEVETDGKIVESPAKLKQYLIALGYRPISLAVDLGNFMMAITGQPYHFYDLDKVKSLNSHNEFVVKDDFEGELETLADKNVKVEKGDIVVTDGITPMCLGGVMGLKNVETELTSTHFAIEAANFSYVQVRHTVKRTGLVSDSAQRFIKKVNPQLIEDSLLMLATVYKSIDPSFTVKSYSLYDEQETPNRLLPFSLESANHRLGGKFTHDEVAKIFKDLRFVWEDDKVLVPVDRPDIKEQADLEEEIFRYSDPSCLDNTLDKLPLTSGRRTAKQELVRKVREYLIANGLYEVVSYTLIDEKLDRSYRIFNEKEPSIRIGNPMTADHEYVRSDLTSSLVKTVNYNRARQKNNFGMFEVGEVHYKDTYKTYLTICLTGKVKEQGSLISRKYDFFDIKGYFEGIFGLTGILPNRYQLRRASQDFFHPGRSADVFVGKEKVASFGQINPRLEKEETYVLEIDISALINIKTGVTKFVPFSIYPDVERDYAFVLDNSVSSGDLISTIKKAVGSTLKSAEIFDIYQIDKEKKSLAVKLLFTSMDHTFKEEELNILQEKVINSVVDKLGGSLR